MTLYAEECRNTKKHFLIGTPFRGKSDSRVNIFAREYGVWCPGLIYVIMLLFFYQDLKSQEPVTLDFLDAELEDEVKVDVSIEI